MAKRITDSREISGMYGVHNVKVIAGSCFVSGRAVTTPIAKRGDAYDGSIGPFDSAHRECLLLTPLKYTF
jgi:hypothetical protein